MHSLEELPACRELGCEQSMKPCYAKVKSSHRGTCWNLATAF